MKKNGWKIIVIIVILGIAGFTGYYFYATRTIEIVVKDMNAGCNHDGRHHTIISVEGEPGSRLTGKLVLLEGTREFYDKLAAINTSQYIRVKGSYSFFEHSEWWAGCTGAHSFEVKELIGASVKP